MNMGDLRVKVDSQHFELYNDLTQAGVVNESHGLFFACACLGFRQNRSEEPKRRVDKFWSRTFTNDEWACMYTMALSRWHGDFDHIRDDKDMINLMEQYATAGLNILVADQLSDFLLKGTNEPRLDQSAVRDLPQLLLFELWQLAGEAHSVTVLQGGP